MLVDFEPFEETLASEAGADACAITRVDEGFHLKFVRGEATCERVVTEAEMDQPWEAIAAEAKAALDA